MATLLILLGIGGAFVVLLLVIWQGWKVQDVVIALWKAEKEGYHRGYGAAWHRRRRRGADHPFAKDAA